MSAIEFWSCDWHADPPESQEDVVYEDTAKDAGWLVLEHKTVYESSEGSRWPRTEIKHVCPDCLKELECLVWIAENGMTYFGDDRGLPRQLGAVWAADLVRDLRDESGTLDIVIGKAVDDARTVGAGEIATTRAVRKALAAHLEAVALSPGDQDA